jgi:hypothetical protein
MFGTLQVCKQHCRSLSHMHDAEVPSLLVLMQQQPAQHDLGSTMQQLQCRKRRTHAPKGEQLPQIRDPTTTTPLPIR